MLHFVDRKCYNRYLEFIWASERDGYMHLYLYAFDPWDTQGQPAVLISQLTIGSKNLFVLLVYIDLSYKLKQQHKESFTNA